MSKITIAMVTCDLCGYEAEGQQEMFAPDLPERWVSVYIKEQERKFGIGRLNKIAEAITKGVDMEPEPPENDKRVWLSLDICPDCYETKVRDFARRLNESRCTPAKEMVRV